MDWIGVEGSRGRGDEGRILTGQLGDALVGDGSLAEVEDLELLEVLADHLEAGVAELGGPEVEVPKGG
jgi:hypothetical protein